MPYILQTDRSYLKSSLGKLANYVNQVPAVEDALSTALAELLQRYIGCGCGFKYSTLMPSPSCDPVTKEVVEALSSFDDDAIEGVLNYFISSLLGLTLCREISYKWINRAIGVLQRVARLVSRQECWGDESIRLGRVLGVLRCVELEFYRRVAGPYEDGARITRNGDLLFYSEVGRRSCAI